MCFFMMSRNSIVEILLVMMVSWGFRFIDIGNRNVVLNMVMMCWVLKLMVCGYDRCCLGRMMGCLCR